MKLHEFNYPSQTSQSYAVIIGFRVNPADFNDVADDGSEIRKLAQKMVSGDADFPDAINIAVCVYNETDNMLYGQVIDFAGQIETRRAV